MKYIVAIAMFFISVLGCAKPTDSTSGGGMHVVRHTSNKENNTLPPSDQKATRAIAGRYYLGDGLGLNLHLTLARDNTFRCQWTGCLGVYGNCAGKWSLDNSHIMIRATSRDGMFEKSPLEDLGVVYRDGNVLLVPSSTKSFFNEYGPRQYTCFSRTHAAAKAPVLEGSRETPIIAVWREDLDRLQAPRPFVITAIWANGKVIWSKDNVQGGPPYFEGAIDPKVVEKALHSFEASKGFAAPYMHEEHFGPDAAFVVIYLANNSNVFLSKSWHELQERNNPKVAAASHGRIVYLKENQSREEFLKADDAEYQEFRVRWAQARIAIAALLPKTGKEKPFTFKFRWKGKGGNERNGTEN